MPDLLEPTSTAPDVYLGQCMRNIVQTTPIPPWPIALNERLECVKERIAFHGIALLLVNESTDLPGWPEDIQMVLREEALQQAFWEEVHRSEIAQLIEAFFDAGITATVMKGTALAYSVYSDPAIRRRGDTDLLVEHAPKSQVRAVLRACGFDPHGDRLALQEPWAKTGNAGFVHEVDLHWRISSSMAVSRALEGDHPRQRRMALPRLSAHAFATGLVDNFILTCINRAAHETFGYLVDGRRMFDGNRLIWAMDLDRIAARFYQSDWEALARASSVCGASGIVVSGMDFSHRTLGTQIPPEIRLRVQNSPIEGEAISGYFSPQKASSRMSRDLASAQTFAEIVAVLTNHAFPGRDVLRQRFPDSQNWPIAALHLRRMVDVGWRILLGKNP